MNAGDPLSLRCADLAQADGYRPAGTAASAPLFLLIEAPLPWPADVGQHPLLLPLAPIVAAHRARVQGLVPDGSVEPTPAGTTRVIVYRRPPGPFRRFTRHERLVPTAELAAGVEALLASAAAAGGAGGPDGDASPGGEAELVDILVCTHGSRDVCCGGAGTRAHRDLTALALPGVRLWRTSHTGGHRFAPTAITFPDGRAWASADAKTLASIVTRSLSPQDAVGHDRGCAAFDDPFTQAADGAVLAVEGWGWLDVPRTADSVHLTDDRRTVTVTGHVNGTTAPRNGNGNGSEPVVYRAEVVVRRVVPVPDCGRPLDEARKSSPDLEVVELTRL
jgi:hypothetical protein